MIVHTSNGPRETNRVYRDADDTVNYTVRPWVFAIIVLFGINQALELVHHIIRLCG